VKSTIFCTHGVLVACALTLCGCKNDVPDDVLVDRTFQAYRSAVLDGAGKSAAEHLDAASIDYYTRLRTHVLEADEATIRSLPAGERFQVLYYRHTTDLAKLREGEPTALFRHGIETGSIDRDSLEKMSLGEIEIDGDIAVATVNLPTGVIEKGFYFRRENDAWKVSLSARMDAVDEKFAADAKEAGLELDAYLVLAVATSSGSPVDASIWERPKLPALD